MSTFRAKLEHVALNFLWCVFYTTSNSISMYTIKDYLSFKHWIYSNIIFYENRMVYTFSGDFTRLFENVTLLMEIWNRFHMNINPLGIAKGSSEIKDSRTAFDPDMFFFRYLCIAWANKRGRWLYVRNDSAECSK